MSKVTKPPSTSLLPVPAVLVTTRDSSGRPNMLTIAWTGIMASTPPMVSISLQPTRHSVTALKETGEYVINIPSANLVRKVDYCGIVSGKDVDKFAATGLTEAPAAYVKAPLIKECPMNLECRVKHILNLGSHEAYIAEVLAVHYNEEVLDEKGNPDVEKLAPYAFSLREYRALGERIGSFGFSAQKK